MALTQSSPWCSRAAITNGVEREPGLMIARSTPARTKLSMTSRAHWVCRSAAVPMERSKKRLHLELGFRILRIGIGIRHDARTGVDPRFAVS